MTLARVHVSAALTSGQTLELPEATAHYINRVLRLAAGDALVVFNDAGAFNAELLAVKGSSARARVGEPLRTATASPLQSHLIQGLCRGPRMDYCVQKATELGVNRITPLVTQRCVVRLDARRAAKRVEHWQAVAVSACEQSGRTDVPTVDPPLPLAALLQNLPPCAALLDADAGQAYGEWRIADNALAVIIGPEGGLAPQECEALVAAGAARWRMGPRVLRTETAGVVALALAQARWGDLG